MKCLFTSTELNDSTDLEHTIPKSLGGKIATRAVSSSAFNTFGGNEFVGEMKDAYLHLIHTLNPMFSSELRKKRIKVEAEHKGVWLASGGIQQVGPVIEEYDKKGNPVSVLARNEREAREFAEKKGIQLEETVAKIDIGKTCLETVTISPRVEIGFLVSALMTIDHFRDQSNGFTRSDCISEIRNLVNSYFKERQLPAADWKRICLGMQFERCDMLNRLRDQASFTKSQYEHQIFVNGDPRSKTVDLIFHVFGNEPYGYRLSRNFEGPAFAYTVINGVFSSGGHSDLIEIEPIDGPMCGIFETGSFHEPTAYRQELIAGHRAAIIPEARLFVESNGARFVHERFMHHANAIDHAFSIRDLVKRRILHLFSEKVDSEFTLALEEALRKASLCESEITRDESTGEFNIPNPETWFNGYVSCLRAMADLFGPCDGLRSRTTWTEKDS